MVELLEENVKITTGDGTVYELPYGLSTRSLDFNISEFDFIDTEGVFVDREMPRALRYDLPLYFTGENSIERSEAFVNSAKDKRFWIVEHPIHGVRNMQPVSLVIDPTNILHIVVTVSLVETITSDGLLISQNFTTNILASVDELNDLTNEVTASNIYNNQTELNTLTDTANSINTNLRNKINLQEISNEYSDLFNKLNTTVGGIAVQPIDIMRTISTMLLMPKNFIDNIKGRLEFVKSQFASFGSLVVNLDKIYSAQFLGASVLTAYASTTIPDDTATYKNLDEIDKVVDDYTEMYVEFMTKIQSVQSVNGFVMDYKIYYGLYSLYIYTINHLYEIALNIPTIVETVTTVETNPIRLSHQYNIDIDKIFELNNWSIAQIYSIPVGTKFRYYV